MHELVTSAYRQSFFQKSETAVASARAGNVVGGGDWAKDRLIPDIVKAFIRKDAVIIRNPDSIRPWQLVLEPLSGYLTLAQRLVEQGQAFAEAWNFGPWEDDAKPVKWIVDRMVGSWGEAARWQLSQGEHPHEAYYLKLDISKARSRLGWQPRTNLGTTLEWIVEWYKGWDRDEDVKRLSEIQIEKFIEMEPDV